MASPIKHETDFPRQKPPIEEASDERRRGEVGSGQQEKEQPLPAPPPREDHPEVPELTPREFEILELIAHGLENHEIAERLVISTETVKCHVRNLRAKLGARSRAHGVAIAFHLGLIRDRRDRRHTQPGGS